MRELWNSTVHTLVIQAISTVVLVETSHYLDRLALFLHDLNLHLHTAASDQGLDEPIFQNYNNAPLPCHSPYPFQPVPAH